MHKTRTPLYKWFWAIFLCSRDKRGISATTLRKQIGISHWVAWTIRDLLSTFCFFGVMAIAASQVQAGPFVDNGDGTVTDQASGIIWQQEDDGVARNWADAFAYCDGLEYAGLANWWLPTVEEWSGLVNYFLGGGATFSLLGLDAVCYWTATACSKGSHNYVFSFWDESTNGCDLNEDDASLLFTRCVTSSGNSGSENNYEIYLRPGGSLNGQSINTSNPVINVSPGENLSGTIKIQHIKVHSSDIVPLIYTPNWGNHSTSYNGVAYTSQGTHNFDVSINNLQAPTTPGTYLIIFASAGRYTYGQVAAVDNCNCNQNNPLFGDGNDIADLTKSDLPIALSEGVGEVLSRDCNTGSYGYGYAGITYVEINVSDNPPSFRAEAVNPQSSKSFYNSFFSKPDLGSLASGGSFSTTITADGESRLLLRFFSDEPVSVTVAVEGADPANGSLSDLNGYLNAGWDDTSVTVSVDHPYGEGYVGYAVYRAPRDFTIPGCEDKLTRPASLAINHPGGTETLSLTIRRPPIFLSHGLWSSPDVLEDFKNDLWNRFSDTGGKNIDDFIRANDGRVVNAAHFDAGAATTKSNIRDYLKDLRQRGSTVTQVDYMGHSMGGIWGRLVKQIYPQDVFTYDKGYINKIITVDTPHLGSFLADLGDIVFDAADGDYDIWGMGNIKDALCNISLRFDHPMCDGAVEDLTTEGCVDLLEDVYLPSHAVVGNKYIDTACLLLSLSDRIPDAHAKAAAKLFKVMEMILKMINSDWGCENWINLLDVPTYTDYVVSLTSQKGGLDEPFEVSEFNMWHMGCYNEDVNGEVLDLLNTSVDNPVFADYFDAAGDLVSLEYLMNLEQLKQKARKKSIRPRAPLSVDAGIAFVTPSGGEVISPGDTVVVEITTTGGLILESLLVIDPYSDPVDITAPPYTTSFNVPLDAHGSYSLTALGEGTDGELYGAEVTLDVNNPATLVSLEVSPKTLFIDTGGAVGVSVMGEFTDGSLRNLSKGSTGTTYESGNIGIVTVDANGTCTGISAGTADMTVHHGAQPAVAVAVEVAQPYINAAFTADKYVGSMPLAVNFTDISAGYIDQWQWSFGDGGMSTDRNPSHTYSYAGNYTVTLTVTGPGGSDSDTEVIVVTGVPNEPGDGNGDGTINVQDVICLINVILDTGTASGSPDCNEDGNVNVQDVICVINKILGG